ncbi:MAG: M20/M25/M40 family metallo-hydrolase [Patescibacteria group bacterium]
MLQSQVIERLLKYARVNTRSLQAMPGEELPHPSSPEQVVLIDLLLSELSDMGVPSNWTRKLEDASFLIEIPATEGHENAPHVVLAAHVDTYFGCPGGANPIIHEYQGGDIALPNDNVVIPASDLAGLEGKGIITADGTTLLGGDDKCGVAAIMTFIESMLAHNLPHGPLTIWICTDEEVGEVGVKFLPSGTAEKWDFFWTVDGERLEVVDIGCFYGSSVDVEFIGNDSHPGVSGHSLKPAHYAACRFVDQLGLAPTPWRTSGEESFIYVPSLPACTAGKSTIKVFPRTFRQEEIPEMRETIRLVAEEAASHYGVQAVVSEAKILYVSTEVAIDQNRHLLQPGLDAIRKFWVEPKLHRVRAGTDGAMLNMTYPKIPSPNMGAGARNLHGVREFVVREELQLVPEIISEMIGIYATMSR